MSARLRNVDEHQGPIARGDGTPDVWEALQLSGEPPVPQIQHLFDNGKLKEPMNLVEYEQVVLHMKDYRHRYQEYWESTVELTDTGTYAKLLGHPERQHLTAT